MKKLLLLVFASLTIGAANAQIATSKSSVKPNAKQEIKQTASKRSFKVLPAKSVKATADKTVINKSLETTLKPVVQKVLAAKRAGAVQEAYEGTATDRSTNETVNWEMLSGVATDGQTLLLQDVVPNPFGFDHTTAPYTITDNKIVIKPTLVASSDNYTGSPSGKAYIFLEDAKSSDGSITLTLDDKGSITGSYEIIYSIYPNETYNYNEWISTYAGYANVQYSLPGEIKAPVVSFEPSSLILYAGMGLNGYSFTNNLSITGAYANTTFANRTTDTATGWDWSATYNDESALLTGTSKDFSVYLKGGDLLSNVTLVGNNKGAESEPYTLGIGTIIDEQTGAPRYTDNFIYAGSSESQFLLNNETPAIITRQNPDGDLTFYTNWATPDKASNSMSKIYVYHEKPATPLYIEGVTLPMVNFSAEPNFNLHIKIVKVNYPATATRPTLGEVIAEADATTTNVNDAFDAGLTAVEFDELYKENEDGLTEPLDYLFIDSDFVILIEGWNNGTFTGVLASQASPLDNARTSTWFEMAGEPGTMYAYTTWKTSLFVGLLGATYGYLYTENDKNIVVPNEGGTTSIKVNPMYSNTEANEAGSKTRLWLDDSSDAIPNWLKVNFANEDYTDSYTFDLVFEAEALPAGVDGRSAHLVFVQEGAKLEVNILQGTAATGVEKVTVKKNSQEGFFNLQGVRIAAPTQKGIYISNGKKYVVK